MTSFAHRKSTQGSLNNEDMQALMVQKATELFAVCDIENKGFITKREMQRLQNELPLEPQQLENVFDSLDDDKNGYLTLEEFTNGFGSFLGLTAPSKEEKKEEEKREKVYEVARGEDHNMEDESFHAFIDEFGASEALDDVDVLKSIWAGLRENQPELLSNFEEYMHKMGSELKRSKGDYKSLQTALRNKTLSHDEEMRRMYEEMEVQMNLEKKKILQEEKAKERMLKEDLERELKEKDKQLQDIIINHQKMESMMKGLNSQEYETKSENEKLVKDKRSLEAMLEESQRNLDESRSYINQLKSQQKEEKKSRALAALQANEGIAIERETLVKELDVLREINKKLRDERDEAELRRIYGNNFGELGEAAPNMNRESGQGSNDKVDGGPGDNRLVLPRRLQMKRGSVLSDYMPNMSWKPSDSEDMFEEEIEIDDGFPPPSSSSTSYEVLNQKREQPVGANNSDFVENKFQNYESMTPERVFKVVFIGDSGVGKSSFIHQFCCNVFKPAFQATIGVDFQVKNIKIDNHIIAIQLWDTAGQERFRSITKQYFRKADGVLIMYDVTNENSYKNIRSWMTSVEDGTEEGTVIMVVGNKLDLVSEEIPQVVSTKEGQKFAEEYSALFQETSAKTGSCVYESIEMMARLLMEREDQGLEKALQLNSVSKKKGCCN